ncbi:MAG: hypothetical protein AB1716_22900, partial [Planctomycetota bacterium]
DYGWDYGYSYFDPYFAALTYPPGALTFPRGEYYNPYTNRWERGFRPESELAYRQAGAAEFEPGSFEERITGTVTDISRVPGCSGRPDGVRMAITTAAGSQRSFFLGDVRYVEQHLPAVDRGDRVGVCGNFVDTERGLVFKPMALRTPAGPFAIPGYQFNRRIAGHIVDMRTIPLAGGDTRGVVATIRTTRGRDIDVLLGTPEDVERRGNLEVGERVAFGGYARTVKGHTTYFIQNMSPPTLAGAREIEHYDAPEFERCEETLVSTFRTYERPVRTYELAERPLSREPLRLSGLIDSVYDKDDSQGRAYLMVELEMPDGSETHIALGPKDQLVHLDFEKNQELTVEGYRTTIDEAPVILATQIERGGRLVWVDHERMARERRAREHLARQRLGYAGAYVRPGLRTVRGVIRDLHTQEAFGQDRLVADVQTDDGDRIRVDLGPKDDMANVDVDEGDTLIAWGHWTAAGDRTLLHAGRIEVKGQTFVVTSPPPGEYGLAGAFEPEERTVVIGGAAARELATYRGEVQSVRMARFEGFDQPHALATVQLDTGRTMPVDLGPVAALDTLNIRPGDPIRLRARGGLINDRMGLIAYELSADGMRVLIDQRPGPTNVEPWGTREWD